MITPALCRAARGLLGIAQAELAARSGVSQRAIVGFENGKTTPMRANILALQSALERSGIVFTDNGVAWAPGSDGRDKGTTVGDKAGDE
jgi:transcriptional regulator with XRE-family HTH domain